MVDGNSTSNSGTRFPTNKDEADRMDEAFGQAFDKLSLEEHEKIQFEVHGISQLDQDPPSLESKLLELQEELDAIKVKAAFDRAKYLNKHYTDSRAFRLMFLRSQRFHVRQAAQTLVLHFECKRRLFGDGEILGRNVIFSDLSEGTLEILESGGVQIFPTRDVAGRAVICGAPVLKDEVSPETVARAVWYLYMAVLQEEENQRTGFVSVWYNYKTRPQRPTLCEELHERVQGIPGKLSGIHYCTNDEHMAPFCAGARRTIQGSEQFHFRSHVGSSKDIDFELQTFGIPTQDGPMQLDGSWSVEWHKKWVDMQRAREAKQEACDDESIVLPRRFDVLFGWSKKTRQHTGTMRLMHLCEMNYVAYEAANKYQKTEIAERLVSIIHESNGRFLKKKENEWVEVSDLIARDKISHCFRNLRSNSQKATEAKPPDEPN